MSTQVDTIHIKYKIQYDSVLKKLKECVVLLLCLFDSNRLLKLMLSFCLGSCLIIPSKQFADQRKCGLLVSSMLHFCFNLTVGNAVYV